MMLYSHHATAPAPLPHRIRFADGSTRTDRDTAWLAAKWGITLV